MFRDSGIVFTVSTAGYASGESWWITVSVPSAFDANALELEGSYPAPSTPVPIGTFVTTFPVR